MASPSTTISRFDLSGSFEEFDLAMSRNGFIGHRVAVPRPVGIQKANIGKVPLEALLQDRSTQRAPGAPYSRSTFEFDQFGYECIEHGCEEAIDDWESHVYEDILDAEMIHQQRAEDALLRGYEREVAAAIFNATTFAGMTADVTDEWDDYTNATPLDNIATAKQAVLDASGLRANALILNSKVFYNLRRVEQLVELIKYSSRADPGAITASMIGQATDLPIVLVGDAVYNAAHEGQDPTPTSVWSDEYAMVARVAVSRDPREPCLARTFCWTGDGPSAPGTGEPLAVLTEEYREEGVRSSVIRARHNRDVVVMYAAAGYLIGNVTTI